MNLIYASAEHLVWYLDARFYIVVCIALFFLLIFRQGAHKAIAKSLDDRADKIRHDLDEARRLREEAQALLASYQRKQKEAESQAEDIVNQARKDAEAMAASARKELGERIERRTVMAETKIANAEAKALSEVKAKAADLALDTAEQILRANIKPGEHANLIKDGIAQMGKTLN